MSKVSFKAIDFSKHPEMIQFDGHNVFALKYDGILAKKYLAYASVKRSLGYCLDSIYYINSHREKTDEPRAGPGILDSPISVRLPLNAPELAFEMEQENESQKEKKPLG